MALTTSSTALSFLLPKLYTNTLLSTLVARKSKRQTARTDIKTDNARSTINIQVRPLPGVDHRALLTQKQ